MLIAVLACALAGCWEEIHYTAPPPETKPKSAAVPVQTHDEASAFADDVAKTLAEGLTPAPDETASAVGEPANTPTPTPTPTPPTATAPVSEPTSSPARSPRRIAWLLGTNLSLAALANDRAAAEDQVADWFDKSQRLARLLGTIVADLPPRPAAEKADPQADRAIEYLFAQGQSIGRHLGAGLGDDHAALFELAVKSNILLVLYTPNSPVVKTLSAAINQAGGRANLPPELWEPLLKLLDEGAPFKVVRDAVFKLHADVDLYLKMARP